MNKKKYTHGTKNKEKNDNITRVWQNGFPTHKPTLKATSPSPITLAVSLATQQNRHNLTIINKTMTDIKEQFLNELRHELNLLEVSTRPAIKNKKWGHLENLAERGISAEKFGNDITNLVNKLVSKDEYKNIDIKGDIELFEKVKSISNDIVNQRFMN